MAIKTIKQLSARCHEKPSREASLGLVGKRGLLHFGSYSMPILLRVIAKVRQPLEGILDLIATAEHGHSDVVFDHLAQSL
jgi:hypothetical protein